MPDLSTQISEAKSQGYNDDEIVGFLGSSHADLAPKIKEAQSNGYQPGEILGHLATLSAPADMGGYQPGASESRSRHSQMNEGPLTRPFGVPSSNPSPGFFESTANAMRGPWDLASSLDTINPQDVLEGLLSPLRKATSGNVPGALGDVAGSLAIGKLMSGPSGPKPVRGPIGPVVGRALDMVPLLDLGGKGGKLLQAIREYRDPTAPEAPGPVAPEPFRPSSITKSRMPTFVPGAEEQFRSTPGTIIPRKGFTPPPDVAPELPPAPSAPEPFAPGKATKRNMPAFVPGETDYGQPGKIIPRGKFEPPPEAAPEKFEPFKPSTRTAKLVRGKPADNPYGGTPGKRIVGRGGRLAAPPEEESIPPSGLEGKTIPPEAIEAEIAKRTRPEPVVKEEVRSANMADPEEVAKSAFHTAYRKFPKATYQQELERVIREQIGENKTRAWTPEGIAKAKALGKQVLTPAEWDKVHKFLDKLPNKSIEPPPQ